MKQQIVRFCAGCGQLFDDIQPKDGQARWVNARTYLVKYGVAWQDLKLVDDACLPCKRVFACARRVATPVEMEVARRS